MRKLKYNLYRDIVVVSIHIIAFFCFPSSTDNEEIWRRAKIMRVVAANGEWHCTLHWHKQSRCAHALPGSITLRLQTLQQFGVVFPNGVLVPESSSEDEMG